MHIAMLSEGDAERWDGAFSGIAKGFVDQLRAHGHTVTTLDCDVFGWQRMALAARTVRPRRIAWKAQFHFGTAAFAARSRSAAHGLRSTTPDLLFQYGATFAPPRVGAPYVLYCDWNMALSMDEAPPDLSEIHALPLDERQSIRAREGEIYQRAAAIFTISERLRRAFIEEYKLPPDRVHTVYPGANFDTSALPKRPARTPDHRPTILFVGKQFVRKGGDLLLDVFANIRRELPGARLLIAGPARLGVEAPGVEVLGSLSKSNPSENRRLLEAYASADVFCLPTRYDPFPSVVREAMYFALPCVTTDIWAMTEMVTDGVTGFTVALDDRTALTTRLLDLLRNSELAFRLGQAGQRKAIEKFSWSTSGARLDQLLRQIVTK